MISRLVLSNIRAFGSPASEFRLAPLTAFCGTNSAGKSTLLKILLLMKQSMTEDVTSPKNDARLKFAGKEVDLGDYKSLVTHNDLTSKMTIGVGVRFKMNASAVALMRRSGVGNGASTPGEGQRPEKKEDCELHASFHFCSGGHQSTLAESASGDIEAGSDQTKRGILHDASFAIHVGDQCILNWSVIRQQEAQQGKYLIRIPVAFFRESGGFEFLDVPEVEGSPHLDIPVILKGMLPMFLVGRFREAEKNRSEAHEEKWNVIPPPPIIASAITALQKAFSEIHYLAPLRSPARRYYLAPREMAQGLDPAGEYLPFMLNDLLPIRISHWLPDQARLTKEPFAKALNRWLAYLRTGNWNDAESDVSELEVITTKDVVVEFKVVNLVGRERHSLVDSGFGYSQVLPILVRGLLMRQRSTLIIEQPELHLNPALQVRLASFLVSLVRSGKQVIIETHSEHIINAVRVLTAEDETGALAKSCTIYFVDADEGQPVATELSLRPDGTVPDWPSKFFGEAEMLTGRLLRAQRRFRK